MMEKGLVVRTTGLWCRVVGAAGTYDCRLRGNYRLRGSKQTNPIAVGDIVDFELQADGTGIVVEIHDRRNYIVRRATKLSKQTHVIAANIDLMCIIATIEHPRTSTGFIDRLLATAEAYGITACIVYNKCDIYSADTIDKLNHLKDIYNAVGYTVYTTSALTGDGVDVLRAALTGKTTLFCGHSGSGKSSLLNAIDSSLQLKVGEVSRWSDKGTHTTTFAEMFQLAKSFSTQSEKTSKIEEADGYVIDTPGIKEFGMVDFSSADLSHYFPELKALQPQCRYANCTHRHEPGCAVRTALAEGRIDSGRFANYLNILESLDS